MNRQIDLTALKIQDDNPYHHGYSLRDYSSGDISDCSVEVFFRNHKDHLLQLINNYSYVVGCVAWLTDLDVLEAMATNMEHVSIIVQKEDFLRPDGSSKSFYADLRKAYKALPSSFGRFDVDSELVSSLSVSDDNAIEAVRCVGNHNRDQNPAFPRMHNKFLVFTNDLHVIFDFMIRSLDITEEDEGLIDEIPNVLGISDDACVWTGSYNISNTATKSFENAIVIHNKDAATCYFREWAQITALSEPLDWTSEWCAPEWRIGT